MQANKVTRDMLADEGIKLVYGSHPEFIAKMQGGMGCVLEQLAEKFGLAHWGDFHKAGGPLKERETVLLYRINDVATIITDKKQREKVRDILIDAFRALKC